MIAKCGRDDSHGAHTYGRTWCAGNRGDAIVNVPADNHVHDDLDRFGYCRSCGRRVMTHFRGFPLPDRPRRAR